MSKKKKNHFQNWIDQNIDSKEMQVKVKKIFKSDVFLKKQSQKKMDKLLNKVKISEDQKQKVYKYWQSLKETKTKSPKTKAEKAKEQHPNYLEQFLNKKNLSSFAKEQIVSKFKTLAEFKQFDQTKLQIFFEDLEFDMITSKKEDGWQNLIILKSEMITKECEHSKPILSQVKSANTDFLDEYEDKISKEKAKLQLILDVFLQFVNHLETISNRSKEKEAQTFIDPEPTISAKEVTKYLFDPVKEIDEKYFRNYEILFRLFTRFSVKFLRQRLLQQIQILEKNISNTNNQNGFPKIKENFLKSQILKLYAPEDDQLNQGIQLKNFLSNFEMKITEVTSDAIKEFVCTKQKRVDDLMKIASDFGFDLCELRKKYFREYSSDLANVN